jgi:energy-coupling factor transporter ATP-binding protein EcfA2
VADRVMFMDRGRILLDAPVAQSLDWLAEHRPAYLPAEPAAGSGKPRSEPVCRLENISFSYRAGLPVLADADLEIGRGEIVALEGPNGSGKTTLAKVAAGLLEPDAGVVWRAGRAGYLSQDPGRYMVRERVIDEVALAVQGDRSAARSALEGVDLAWAAERHPRDLSSGERERLGLAAVTVAEPELLVLDEPTRGIDPARKAVIAAWLAEYAERGHGVLVATHDRAFPADRRVSLGAEALVGV